MRYLKIVGKYSHIAQILRFFSKNKIVIFFAIIMFFTIFATAIALTVRQKLMEESIEEWIRQRNIVCL